LGKKQEAEVVEKATAGALFFAQRRKGKKKEKDKNRRNKLKVQDLGRLGKSQGGKKDQKNGGSEAENLNLGKRIF